MSLYGMDAVLVLQQIKELSKVKGPVTYGQVLVCSPVIIMQMDF